MKKGDKLFNAMFVHFMWDDELKGKEGFVDDSIDTLVIRVNDNVGLTVDKLRVFGPVHYGVNPHPFSVDGINYRFFYHDPHYEYKKAWLEGKRVQYMSTIYVKNDWKDIPDEWNWDVMGGTQYRIAPEKKWRPFKDIAELKQAWNIKLTGRTDIAPDYGLGEPMIWVRDKERPDITRLITDFNAGSKSVALAGQWHILEHLFDDYTFLDGEPCGVLVSTEEDE